MIDISNLLYILTLISAGLIAGIITGFVSASASVIITPMLTILLGFDVYSALGISLAADVVASLTTTYVYHKHECVKYKKSFVLIIVAVLFTILGSFFTRNTSDTLLGGLAGVGICMLAFQFIKGNFETRLKNLRENKIFIHFSEKHNLFIVVSGIVIGLNTGILGAGGGVLILFTLLFAYNIGIKSAIGTSAFTMSMIALCGSIAHFYYGDFAIFEVVVTSIGSYIGAYIASHYVHISSEKRVTRLAGIMFSVIGITMAITGII
ncbi:sulfite exporter TauE/SafE family protein [Vallitalea okinawensis]|uniref:sulfite exporter TauE/SafE family protein n=1 Tax=Vallitalea okinawensis TaxID=2078660 RepID=UPI000CFBC80B|nr:sulfite exporter TauE/SafE family protein [Vallitalea okinawensis]